LAKQIAGSFYWQLRRHDRVKDLAIRALQFRDRELTLPLTASDVQAFLTAVDAAKLVPLYLLQVPAQDIDAGVLAQLSGMHQCHAATLSTW
jgi:phage gp46-like protein